MLVVVHDWNIERFDQAIFDLKTARSADVFEIYSPEHRRDARDRLNDFVDVLGVETDWESVDVGELLKEHRLAFHNRKRSERPDIAQAEHGRSVGDNRHGVAFDR